MKIMQPALSSRPRPLLKHIYLLFSNYFVLMQRTAQIVLRMAQLLFLLRLKSSQLEKNILNVQP